MGSHGYVDLIQRPWLQNETNDVKSLKKMNSLTKKIDKALLILPFHQKKTRLDALDCYRTFNKTVKKNQLPKGFFNQLKTYGR